MTKLYRPGQLRIVRDSRAPLTADKAYRVEEVATPHQQVSAECMTEKAALNLMWDLGSPYPGKRYPDDPWDRTLSPLTPPKISYQVITDFGDGHTSVESFPDAAMRLENLRTRAKIAFQREQVNLPKDSTDEAESLATLLGFFLMLTNGSVTLSQTNHPLHI